MPVPFVQNSFASGEADPALRQRSDVKVFYTSLEKATNILPRPQSGFKLRGGLRHVRRARNILTAINISGAAISTGLALTSGTIGALLTGPAGCTFAAQGGASILFQLDLGALAQVSACDLIRFSSPTGGLNWLIFDTSPDAVTWTEWQRRDLRPSVNTRRVATAPNAFRSFRYLRVRTAGATGALIVSQLALWLESANKSVVSVFRHQAEYTAFMLVVTAFNIDVFQETVWLCSVPAPYSNPDIMGLTSAHDPGAALLFNQNFPVRLVQQRGSEWEGSDYVFTNIPTRLFPDTGLTEAIMSATRGYAGCGCFWNQRLVIGGFRSLPQTLVLSKQGEPTNLDTSGTLATDGMLFDLVGDEQGVPTIRRLRAGPFLEVFTQLSFFYSTERIAAKGQGFGFVLSERTPIRQGTRVVDAANLAYFIEDGAAVIRQLAYNDDSTERYTTTEISVFNAHLVKGASQMAARPVRTTQGCTLLSVIRDDGGWTICSLLPSQQLVGFTGQNAGGNVLATATVGLKQDIVLVVDRGAANHIELLDDTTTLDMSITANCAPVITGLEHLNGRNDVWLRCDQAVLGPLTVTDGQISVDLVATGTCEIGVPFQWTGEQMRLAGDAQRQVAFNRTISVGVVKLTVDAATAFDMTVDDAEWRTVEVPPRADILDPTLAQRVFQGEIEEDGFFGLPDGKVRLRGSSVWPFELVSILREATW